MTNTMFMLEKWRYQLQLKHIVKEKYLKLKIQLIWP